jgi:hypothetical protein
MARRIWIATLAVASVATLGAQMANGKGLFDYTEFNQAKESALQCEAQGKWKQIHWRSNFDQVLADSKATQKPILVVLVVGKQGEKHAAEC